MITTISPEANTRPRSGVLPTAEQLDALTTVDLYALAGREAAEFGTISLFNDHRYRIGDYGPRAQSIRTATAQQHAAAHLAYVAELDRRAFGPLTLDYSDTEPARA
jgi:hypothetical protein